MDYTIESDVLGLSSTLINIDIHGKDDAYEAATRIGSKFPGGTFYFRYKPYTITHGIFEILYNVDLVPDDDDIPVEVSFKASYDITINPSSSYLPKYVFNVEPIAVTEFIAIAAIAIVTIGIATGLITIPIGLLGTLYSGLTAFNILVPET